MWMMMALLSSTDLAYSHLRIWQDVNHDGQAQSYELQTLQSLGISELNIATGQFTRTTGGTTAQGSMGLANLQADSAGYLTQVAGNSLLAIGETGEVNLYVSATADYGKSTSAAVRAAHTHVSVDGSLSTIDESMDGLENTAVTVITQ
jgi:hypothetical protein